MTSKRTGLLAIAALALTACGGAEPEDKIADVCTSVFASDRMGEEVARLARSTVPEFCACHGKRAVAAGQGDVTLAVLTAIQNGMKQTGQDAEDVAEGLDEAIEADASAYPFSEQDVDDAGEFLEETTEAMRSGCKITA